MECPICWNSYCPASMKPMILPCGHTVCERCLTRVQTCPLCRDDSIRPSRNRLHSLLQEGTMMPKVNFSLLELLESRLREQKHFEVCETHQLAKYLFCTECKICLCEKCVDSEHPQHTLKKVSGQTVQYEKAIQAQLQKISSLELSLGILYYSVAETTQINKNLAEKHVKEELAILNKLADLIERAKEALHKKVSDAQKTRQDILHDAGLKIILLNSKLSQERPILNTLRAGLLLQDFKESQGDIELLEQKTSYLQDLEVGIGQLIRDQSSSWKLMLDGESERLLNMMKGVIQGSVERMNDQDFESLVNPFSEIEIIAEDSFISISERSLVQNRSGDRMEVAYQRLQFLQERMNRGREELAQLPIHIRQLIFNREDLD